ncbi:ABC transporter ATP-binding protein [Allorhizobium terrae]|uniref:ABC transporter ATP-binding protein n=1 Tax=Allorhizobium terrae TaxID=1848972 RepID=A0A4S3ZPC4_9HYPH|nr:ABC transporter ATP-binding protein [Allorhizobium terrae]THF47350.1 ABC transporter ATP-binding protein [Allorhizobium terrae]TWD46030.1 ATP-binding cassette subfamily B protein [Agrobacterium vitis]
MFAKFISNANKTLLFRLLSENFKSQAPWYGIAILAMIVVAAMTSASAWIMRDIVNSSVVSKDINRVFEVAIMVAVIFFIKGIAGYIQSVFLSRAGNNIIAKTQKMLFSRILKQGISFYSKYPSSELLMRITTNAQAARSVIDLIVTSFVRDLFSLIGLAAVMVIQQPSLTLFSAIIVPGAIYGVRHLTKKVRKIMEQELASLGMIIQNVQETATGIRVIKAFGLEDYMNARMEKYVGEVEQRSNSIAKLEAASSPIMETLSGFAIAGVVALSGIWVLQEGNTPGELMSFITALLLAYEPAKRLARMRISLETGLIGVRMMYELADHPIDLSQKDNAVELAAGKGEISFRNVNFSYKENHRLFDNLNLDFPAGKTTALVGPSGGGKSSIINLAMRLYDPESGSVMIDGQDLRDVTFESLRNRIAYVGQDTFLFAGTVKHNIGLGREGASDEEIIAAAKAANAHDFIMRMPHGYDSDVGENGGNMSGGQKQRISIARAMLRNAEILILDEATSALDSESEHLIREALTRLTRDRTTVMIAHRLSTITFADNIVVMENGAVAEQGRPAELLSRDGPYRRLYELQLLPTAEQAMLL